jgi:nucleoside-diphosphate-sugar epimerase
MALARQAVDAGVKRFIFMSSIKVNGERSSSGISFNEHAVPAPVEPYGQSKAEAETELLKLAATSPIEVVILRPPLVYGPGVRGNFLRLIRLLERGLPLPFGSLHRNRRTLIGLDNLIDLIILSLRHPAAANQVFLVGDDQDLSTTELLHRIGEALGKPARLLRIPVPIVRVFGALVGSGDEVRRLCDDLQVDSSKVRRLLGWQPRVSVEEGLRRAVRGAAPERP